MILNALKNRDAAQLKEEFLHFVKAFLKYLPSTSPLSVPTSPPSGGFRPAAGEPVSNGAPLQSFMGPPEGDRQA